MMNNTIDRWASGDPPAPLFIQHHAVAAPAVSRVPNARYLRCPFCRFFITNATNIGEFGVGLAIGFVVAGVATRTVMAFIRRPESV